VTTLSDLSLGVYPRSLAEEGVGRALRAATTASPVPVRLVDRTGRRLPSDVEAAVYFCCLEAVQNAVKHADARHIEVLLEDDDDTVRFVVCDDGGGLPAGTPPSGSGLANMRDRIDAAGGVLTVTGRLGAGTSVSGRIPVPANGAGL
jgi:signal transduction histidine kinase